MTAKSREQIAGRVSAGVTSRTRSAKMIVAAAIKRIAFILAISTYLVIHVNALTSTSTISSITTMDKAESTNRTRATESNLISHKSPLNGRQFGDMINDIQIECNSDNIVVVLNTNHGFNGMIYPKGLSKNSTCMTEYRETGANITYYLPLRSCNTMSLDVEDGIEYFNTVMVQPHRRLVTNQGRGYHIKCRYQTKERTITNQDQQLSVNLTQSTPAVIGSATMPSCSMKIFSANDLTREVSAENVKIGDELQLIISLDSANNNQDQIYGMLVTNCLVRDGMNWGEQPLLDDNGCPIDEEIMPQFKYNKNLTKASVTFQAHKFPYTSSVYYQCNVRLCFREGGCQHVPPNCEHNFLLNNLSNSMVNGKRQIQLAEQSQGNHLGGRSKRWIDAGELDGLGEAADASSSAANLKSMSLEVFSGLNVNDGAELANVDKEDPLLMAAATSDNVAASEESPNGKPAAKAPQSAKQQQQQSERDFCLSLRKFAIAISLASLILMAAIITMIACMIHRRNVRKQRERELANANNYYQQQQLPYSNRAYCRD